MELPLKGRKVLDLTGLLPGPYCSMMLGDFGAEVIKIERPGRGDNSRGAKPLLQDTSGYYLLLNRNKKSLTLDFKAAKGKEIFYKLAMEADIILDGFRPGVVKKLGVDYDTIKAMNPGIIYCSISGYGQDGPYVLQPGHDINYLSYAGILGMTGRKGEIPAIPGVQVADLGGGALMAVIGILLALQVRDRTGTGQYVDIAMLDGLISWLPTLADSYFVAGSIPTQGSTRLTGKFACYEVYKTKDNSFISLGSNEKHFWENLCDYFGKEEYKEWQFQDDKQAKLIAFLREQFLLKDRDEWVKILLERDVCIAPVYSFPEVFQDPQVLHREMVFEMDHPRLGKIKQLGFPIKLSETPARALQAPPDLGEHNEEILTRLGYSAEEISQFRANKTI